jgi:hypothetical protein
MTVHRLGSTTAGRRLVNADDVAEAKGHCATLHLVVVVFGIRPHLRESGLGCRRGRPYELTVDVPLRLWPSSASSGTTEAVTSPSVEADELLDVAGMDPNGVQHPSMG